MVCENFNLTELNRFASIHPHTHRIASTIFNVKYGDEKFTIGRQGVQIIGHDQHLQHLGNMDVMYSTLKTFGHSIKNVEVNYDTFSAWEAGKINGRISKFLSNSLTQITFHRFHSDHAKDLSGPFNKVENVTFRDCRIYPNVFNLTDVFPAVRCLHFADYQEVGNLETLVNHHFPHLNEIINTMYNSNSAHLKGILQLNPQVRKLLVQRIDWDFLRTVSEIMPNLEDLEIDSIVGYPNDGRDIRFGSLKSFKVSYISVDISVRLPIAFSENIEEIIDFTSNKNLLDIVLHNKNLKRLITHYYEFPQITDQLPNLEEFHTKSPVYKAEVVDNVVRFVETARNLKRMELIDCGPTSAADILERIKDEWQLVNGSYDRHFIFVRSQ